MENRERLQQVIVKIIHGVLFAGMILAQMPAAALPTAGLANAVPSREHRQYDPRFVVAEGFENLLGRDLDKKEMRQVESFLLKLEAAQGVQAAGQGLVHKAGWLPDVPNLPSLSALMDFSEVLPIMCMYGKVSIKIPGTNNFAVNGFGVGKEITPCLVLNSVLPWRLKVNEFKSYILQGASVGAAEGKLGAVSAGIVGGLYSGPRSLLKPLVGQYYFTRFTFQKAWGKVIVQAALGDKGQKMLMAGVGAELSLDNMASLILDLIKLPKLDVQGLAPGQRRGELGTYYKVYEFPWFQRLISGMPPLKIFDDVDQYIAANN